MREKNKVALRPDIFSYTDYRVFLQNLFLWLKLRTPRSVSYESYAQKAKLSKTFFRYVLNGSRHLSLDKIPSVAKVFRLSREEKHFFTYLVCHGTTQDAETKKFFEFSLQRLKGQRLQNTTDAPDPSPDNQSTFASGLAMVIHSLARQKQFRPDPQWVLSRLPPGFASPAIVSEILASLIETKSILQDERGRWKTGGFVYNRASEINLDAFLVYRKALSFMWRVLGQASDINPLSCHMLSLSFDDDSHDAAVKCLIQCRDDLIKLSKKVEDPSRVLFVSLNLAGVVK